MTAASNSASSMMVYPLPWRLWQYVPSSIRLQVYMLVLLLTQIVRQLPEIYGKAHISAAYNDDSNELVITIPRVTLLPFGLVVKSTCLREALAMCLVNTVPGAPVPRVFDYVSLPPSTWVYFSCRHLAEDQPVLLLMERLQGEPVGPHLAPMSDTQVDKLGDQLADALKLIRSLKPPTAAVAGIGGGRLLSYNMPPFDTASPFENVAALNAFMQDRAAHRDSAEFAALPARDDHATTVFTHGDLTPHNVLVDSDGRLTGIIDFECSGWLPGHWEAANSLYVYRAYKPWARIIHRCFAEYKDQIEAEYKWYGVWGD